MSDSTAILQAIGNRVVLTPQAPERTLANGLVLPDQAVEQPSEGIVHSVGSEVRDVHVGDHVLFGKWAGARVEHDKIEYFILQEEEIIGVFA